MVIEVEGTCIMRYRSCNRSRSGRVEYGNTKSEGAVIAHIAVYHHCVIKEAIETAKQT
jgi:isoprenylcysteine carboxyl methyltransferase (ICMT) family protein YpbQ